MTSAQFKKCTVSLSLDNLPSVVIATVCSYLEWYQILLVLDIWPHIEVHIQQRCTAWHRVTYEEKSNTRDVIRQAHTPEYFLNKCMRRFGRHVSHLKLVFYDPHEGTKNDSCEIYPTLFRELLNVFTVKEAHLISLNVQGAHFALSEETDRHIMDLVKRCRQLKVLRISFQNSENKSFEFREGFLRQMVEYRPHTLQHLDLSKLNFSEGTFSEMFSSLTSLVQLRSLNVKVEHIDENVLLSLVKQNLSRLSLTVDFNSSTAVKEFPLFSDALWENVLDHEPSFELEVVLKGFQMSREVLPKSAPIVCMKLIDMEGSLTAGFLLQIIDSYSNRLRSFICDKTSHDRSVLPDRRVPSMLATLVDKCPKLHTLVFSHALESMDILQIARIRNLAHLGLKSTALLYSLSQKDGVGSNMNTPCALDIGRQLSDVQDEVSYIYGRPWHFM